MSTNGKPNGLARRLPPELAGGLPFLGHALAFRRDPVRLLRRGCERFGDIFSFALAGSKVAVLTGPRGNEAFFRARDDQLSARAAYQFMVPIFGKGIAYDAAPERMDEQLDFFTPALSERRLRAYAQFINEECESFFEGWPDVGEVDLLKMTNELTVFIASRCLIGRDFRQHLSTEFARLYHDLEGGINLLAFFRPHLPLPSFGRRDRARVRMVELISRIISERRAGGVEEEDFLQTLMSARYADGSSLNDDNITGLLLTTLFAGQHTSAVQAAWTGIELLRHPHFLAEVLHEQEKILAGGRELSFDALRDMVLLERGMREAERLHPPLVVLMRKVIGDFRYQQYDIPRGWLAMVSPAVTHRRGDVFTAPDRYDPQRFAPGREEDRKARFAMITFGGGKHGCIGMTFAYLQVKAIWSVLLRRFDLELIDRQPQPNYATFVVGPQPPCRIRYRRRLRSMAHVSSGLLSASGKGR
jgi:sterol 14-demethylase